MQPLFTIGHSTTEVEDFLARLSAHRIDVIVDVRSSPFSRRFPQYSKDALRSSLIANGIKYLFLGVQLGARRTENGCYVNGVAEYGLIAQLPAFKEGISRVARGAQDFRVALMCAEHDPLTCHRTILVCRALKEHIPEIRHILRDGAIESMSDAERRLVDEENTAHDQADFFSSSPSQHDPLITAYDKRGGKIAYRSRTEEEDADTHNRFY